VLSPHQPGNSTCAVIASFLKWLAGSV